jgi:DNA-binding winged helix-turn-helix (wHTH) protein/uncharacterized DUF497 family protein
MPDPVQRPRALRFEAFEMDLDSEELKKNGRKLKLRRQPFRLLATIAERADDLVTYDELRVQFWPKVTIEDYKHSLGNCMLEIRSVLGDSAKNPHYVETLSRGYRFRVPVEFIARSSANGNGSKASLTASLLIEIRQARQELITTSDCRGLALLFFRCERLRNQYLLDPNLPDLQLLMADIQWALGGSALLEPGFANPAISDEVASLVFDDPNAISTPDPFIDGKWKTLGLANESVLLMVEHTGNPENGQRVLIHRPRRATPQERRAYEQRRR